MKRDFKGQAVVLGGGFAGLATACGCLQAGLLPVIFECRPGLCQRQSSPTRGGQARLHSSGAYYPGNPRVARAVMEEAERFARAFPEAVVPVEARYFVPELAHDDILAAWREAGVWRREDKAFGKPLSARFRRKHGIRTYVSKDRAIDVVQLQSSLKAPLRHVEVITNAHVVGSVQEGGRLQALLVRMPDGPVCRFPCAMCFNASGASMERVMAVVNPEAKMDGLCQQVATAVLRFDWPWHLPPMILQLFGSHQAPLLKNGSIIPVGSNLGRASLACSGGKPVQDPDAVPYDLETERQEMLELLREAFDLNEVSGQELSWCVKGLVAPAAARRAEGDSAARLVTVLNASTLGGASNLFLCSPGKVSGVVALMEAVAEAVRAYAQGQESQKAA